MMLVCMMGTFVMTGDNGLNVTNCLFYAVMAIISAIFDLMACVMYFSHSKYGLYEKKAPTMVLVAQTIFIASPIVLFISGCLAYSMYRDCRDSIVESSPFGGGPQRGPPRQPTRAFQGEGQRLGSE